MRDQLIQREQCPLLRGRQWPKRKQLSKEGKPGKNFWRMMTTRLGRYILVVVIKQHSFSEASVKTSHPNLVNLLAAYVYFTYKCMNLSLKQLHSCIELEESHISTICKKMSTY
jgi:hypothetical protein